MHSHWEEEAELCVWQAASKRVYAQFHLRSHGPRRFTCCYVRWVTNMCVKTRCLHVCTIWLCLFPSLTLKTMSKLGLKTFPCPQLYQIWSFPILHQFPYPLPSEAPPSLPLQHPIHCLCLPQNTPCLIKTHQTDELCLVQSHFCESE